MKGVSIIVATKNQEDLIGRSIGSCLNLEWPKGKIEVIVVDDNSSDNTREIVKKFGKRVKLMKTGYGRIRGINEAIKKSKFDYVCLSAGDIIFRRDFLKKIMRYFIDDRIAFVSPFSETGGNATVFRKDVLLKLGGFNVNFGKSGTGFRDDTDMAFRIWEGGYKSVFTRDAKFEHVHKSPKTLKREDKILFEEGEDTRV